MTDEFRSRMVTKWAQTWGAETVNEIITEALNYKKASANWKEPELGVQGWLRREAERGGKQNGITGTNPQTNDAENSRAAREERIAEQKRRAGDQVPKV